MREKKILVVDDEEDFTRFLKKNLELTGKYTVKVENNGLRAHSAAKTFMPDLILLDIMMPVINGAAVCNILESDDLTKHIPVFFLTALVKKTEITSPYGENRNQVYIAKPVNITELTDLMEKELALE